MESKKKIYTKEELRNELLTLIRQIGKDRADLYVFDLNKLLERWERKPESQQFRNYGFGKLTTFLKEYCGVVESPEKEFSIPKKVMFKTDVERHEHRREATPPEHRKLGSSAIKNKKHDARQIQSEDDPFSQAQPESHAAARQKELCDLKFKMFRILKDLLETEKYRRKGEIYVSHDELHRRWQTSHPNEKFKSYGFGNLRDFLIRHCEIKQDKKSDKFPIARMMVEKELDEFKRRSELDTTGILERPGQKSKEEGNIQDTNENKSELEEVTVEPIQEEANELSSKTATLCTAKVDDISTDSPGGASEDSCDNENSPTRKGLATSDTTPEHRIPQSQ